MVAEPQTIVDMVDVNETQKKSNRIQVSNTKKPLFFYLNLAKRYIKQHNYVELSALGMAIPTAVTISEILKANGVAVERRVVTSTVGAKDESKGRLVQKAKLEILLERNDKYGNQKTSFEVESKTKSEAKTEPTEQIQIHETQLKAENKTNNNKPNPEIQTENASTRIAQPN